MAGTLITAGQGTRVEQATFAGGTVTFASSTGTPGVGDLMLVVMTIRSGAGVPNTPSGWTLEDSRIHAISGQKMYIFTRIRQAGDANSFTWTAATAGTTNATAIIQAYYLGGIVDSSYIDVAPVWTESGSTSATVVGPLTGATSTGNDNVAIALWARQDDAGTFSTASSGWTLPAGSGFQCISTLGTDASMGIAAKELATPSASGTFQLNISGGSAFHWMGCVLIFKQQLGTGLTTVTGEAGADEADLGVQTVAEPDVSIVVGTGTTKYDTSQFPPGHGTRAIRHTVAAQQRRFKINCKRPDRGEQYGMAYVFITALPSTSTRIVSLEDYDGTDRAQVRISSAGLVNIANDGASINSSTSTAITLSQWFRVEWQYLGTTAEVRLFKGADLENDVAAFTDNASISGLTAGMVGRCMYGPGTANFTADLHFRDASVKRTTWVGSTLVRAAPPPHLWTPRTTRRNLLTR